MTAGSLPWLVRHELRLWIRDGSRAGRIGRIILVLALLMLPIGFGTGLAFRLRGVADVPPEAIGPVSAICAGLVLLMLSGACIYVLRSFHDRGDLDLLLAAPIPPARVLAAKALAIHTSVALPLLFITAPFLVASALLGHPGWLGGIAMIIISAVIATSMAFIIAGRLFRHLGPRRGRIIIQVGGGLFAGGVAVLAQMPNFAPVIFKRFTDFASQTPPPPLDWPARATFGAPLPLLVMIMAAIACALVSARLAARNLVEASPVEAPGASRRTGRAGQFRSGLPRILLVKELRLLWRDPELLSSLALQLAYMIPAFGLIFSGGGVSPGRLAAACVLFSGLLASSLGWLTVCGEDAPDLIAAAPVQPRLVARMKILAACLPPLAIVVVPVLVTMGQDRRAGAIALVLCLVAAATAAIQQSWAGRPQRRKAFRFRQKGSLLLAISEYVMAGCWGGTASLLTHGSVWALATALLALTILAGSRRMFRAGPNER
jgi:ABC-2 type transport system permease protein